MPTEQNHSHLSDEAMVTLILQEAAARGWATDPDEDTIAVFLPAHQPA